ncbi:MAG: RNA 2',3'-cyclic phosphodiesterase [candidate division KSB1 bacterium]|nr:RNA 2',3'-cyclic phosphodiesterase [candidate division KSB1 bacterium]
MQNKIRTFVCFELPPTVLELLRSIQGRLKPLHDGTRWVNPERIHLTLRFLGDVERERLDAVMEAVQNACKAFEPFTLTVSKTGAFPNFKRPRVFWVGVSDPDQKLQQCQAAIEGELEDIGFPGEKRAFSPHLTLGRVNNSRGVANVSKELERLHPEPVSFPAREVVVMQSKLTPSGAVYTPLRKIGL